MVSAHEVFGREYLCGAPAQDDFADRVRSYPGLGPVSALDELEPVGLPQRRAAADPPQHLSTRVGEYEQMLPISALIREKLAEGWHHGL